MPGPAAAVWSAGAPSALAQYLPADQLEYTPVPVSAPDYDSLPGANPSQTAMRVRLYVDESGTVQAVHPLRLDPRDREFLVSLRRMFEATRYLPGRRQGVPVSSYIDLELEFVAPEEVDVIEPKHRRSE
ncbi:hypothetical protein GCM10025770_01860 [Viridibacterium curvum]|uniref:TonB C-terminal domain-containing protein n=1 Tax=Viridibacterium curvum TaxID=1101404 RepID=A0ABP9Q7I6_9RHOO